MTEELKCECGRKWFVLSSAKHTIISEMDNAIEITSYGDRYAKLLCICGRIVGGDKYYG